MVQKLYLKTSNGTKIVMVQKLYLKTSNGTKIVPKNFFLFNLFLIVSFI